MEGLISSCGTPKVFADGRVFCRSSKIGGAISDATALIFGSTTHDHHTTPILASFLKLHLPKSILNHQHQSSRQCAFYPFSPTVDTEIFETQDTLLQNLETARVRFQLQKECQFGQHILVVGEHHLMGSWEPSKAVPLNWSDGHVWSTEMHIPIGDTIQFKFILRDISGEIEWQPGPDRVLQIFYTKKEIVVLEDWENVELQQITEEEYVQYMMAEPITQLEESLVRIEESSTDTDSVKVLTFTESFEESNGGYVDSSSPRSMIDGEEHVSNNGVPVLVPGLVPVPDFGIEADVPQEVSNGVAGEASVAANEAELIQKQERDPSQGNRLHDEIVLNCANVREEKSCDNGTVSSGHEENLQPTEDSAVDVFKNDIEWGRKTLEKFLVALGF